MATTTPGTDKRRFPTYSDDDTYATAARDAKKISIGIGRRSFQVTAIGRLPSCLT